MPVMDSYIAVNTPALIELNRLAIAHRYNRTFSRAFLDKLDPEGVHIFAHSFIHNDDHVRVVALVKMSGRVEPAHATLDIDLDTYLKLPRFGYDENGDLVEVMPNDPRQKRRVMIPRKERATIKNKLRI